MMKEWKQKHVGEPREVLGEIKRLDEESAEILKLIQGLL